MADPMVRHLLIEKLIQIILKLKRRPLSFALALSLLIHFSLLFFLQSSHEPAKVVVPPGPLELSFDDSGAEAPGSQTLAKTDRQPVASSSVPSQSTMDFNLRSAEQRNESWKQRASSGDDISVASGSTSSQQVNSDPWQAIEAPGQGYSAAVQYGNAMGLGQTLESLPFFQALHRRIDGHLVFPDDFARHRIEGKVRIEAELAQDGRLLRFTSFNSEDRVLPAYLMALLTQVLDRPLRPAEHAPFPRIHVAFDFDFQSRLQGMPPNPAPIGVRKNHLLFARDAIVPSLLEEKIHELFTHYVPPIIPVPGGFYIDFILAYEYVNNLIEGAPTESDARQARIDVLHEKLRSTIHRSKQRTPVESPTPQPES